MATPENVENWMLEIPFVCYDELVSYGITAKNMLGCGSYGCAFETNHPGRVIKFTYNQQEFRTANYLFDADIDQPGIPNVYDTWELKSFVYEQEYERFPIYAIVLDYLADLTVDNVEWFEELTIEVEDALIQVTHDPDEDAVFEHVAGSMSDIPGTADDELKIEEIAELGIAALKHGLRVDDLLVSNLGLDKNGKITIRDLGSLKLV